MFSLGGALFGFPAADGHVLPDEAVPEAWLLLFVEEYADSGVYAGVLTACKTGQTWVLRTAPKARLSCHTRGAKSMAARLTRDRAALAVRGALPTHLGVTCDGSPQSEAMCQAITDMLSGYGSGVTSLEASEHGGNQLSAVYTGFIQRAPSVFPNLRVLELSPCPPSLPPPSAWPQLRDLRVYVDTDNTTQEYRDSCFRSCAPYLSHVTAITAGRQNYVDDGNELCWSVLFTGAAHTPFHTTLTTFDTSSAR